MDASNFSRAFKQVAVFSKQNTDGLKKEYFIIKQNINLSSEQVS
jgi:hypothetical protein